MNAPALTLQHHVDVAVEEIESFFRQLAKEGSSEYSDVSTDWLRRHLDTVGNALFLTEPSGRVIGSVVVHVMPRLSPQRPANAMVTDRRLLRSWWGTDAASILLKSTRAWAQSRGLGRLMMTAPMDSQPAASLLTEHGFTLKASLYSVASETEQRP